MICIIRILRVRGAAVCRQTKYYNFSAYLTKMTHGFCFVSFRFVTMISLCYV